MALSENGRIVFDYVKVNDGKNFTAADIAEATDLGKRSVDGVITAFQKKGLMQRTEAEIELENGTHKTVKFISLTDAGREFDPDAPTK